MRRLQFTSNTREAGSRGSVTGWGHGSWKQGQHAFVTLSATDAASVITEEHECII